MSATHTYAILEVSKRTYREVRKLLLKADYSYAIDSDEDGEVIDMHGIALQARKPVSPR